MKRIYLDYAATTPTDPDIVEAMMPYFRDTYGNPSSLHSCGRRAKTAIEQARAEVATLIMGEPDAIVFTCSGTESDNLAIKGVAFAMKDRGNHIITSRIEHHAVLESCRFLERNGFKVTYLPVDAMGMVDPEDVKRAITDKTILITIMHANNEIGTIEPIAQIGRIAREGDIPFHTDAVQTYGYLPIDVKEMCIDLLSASSHKLYGPKGVGFLYKRDGVFILPLLSGGEQERGLRPSTYNVPGIVGMGKAAVLARKNMKTETQRLKILRNKLIGGILERIDQARLNGHPVNRHPNNVNIAFGGIKAEPLLMSLDAKGISCSSGSACTSTSIEPSHVLESIGLEQRLARGSIRFSLGRYTTEEDIDYLLDVVPPCVKQWRSF